MLRGEIEDVLVRYAWAFDEDDFDTMRTLFTEHGTFEVSEATVDVIRGPEAIIAFQKTAREARAGRGEQPRHLVNNVRIVEVEADAVTAVSYMTLVITLADGTSKVALAGTYNDRLVREGGAWRIATRQLTFDRHRVSVPAAG